MEIIDTIYFNLSVFVLFCFCILTILYCVNSLSFNKHKSELINAIKESQLLIPYLQIRLKYIKVGSLEVAESLDDDTRDKLSNFILQFKFQSIENPFFNDEQQIKIRGNKQLLRDYAEFIKTGLNNGDFEYSSEFDKNQDQRLLIDNINASENCSLHTENTLLAIKKTMLIINEKEIEWLSKSNQKGKTRLNF